jgi:hypothetical protein
MCIFARLLIAHLLSDIPLNLFAAEKRNGSVARRFSVLALHTAVVFLTTLLFFVDMLGPRVFLAVLLVAAAHFLIDALRLRIEKRVYRQADERPPYSKRKDLVRLFRFVKNPGASWSESGFRGWFVLNLLDQCLHLLVMAFAASWLDRVL